MKRNPSNRLLRQRRGFTLTEVLLVLAILGVIAAMVVPNLMASQREALKRQSRVNISTFESIAKQYAIDHDGDWPPGIDAMMNPGNGSDGRAARTLSRKNSQGCLERTVELRISKQQGRWN